MQEHKHHCVRAGTPEDHWMYHYQELYEAMALLSEAIEGGVGVVSLTPSDECERCKEVYDL